MPPGCSVIKWVLAILPILLLIGIFCLNVRAGILAVAAIGFIAALYVCLGVLQGRPRTCPRCRAKALITVDFYLTNPPPSYGEYRCRNCDARFVRISGSKEYLPSDETYPRNPDHDELD